MTFSSEYNIFFKDNINLTNTEKIDKLKEFDVAKLLCLLRNIEEKSCNYEGEIIKNVYGCLFDKGIICI